MAISLYELSQRISSSMPLGTIVPYYGTDEPSGWKICDGRSCAGSELAKKLGISNVPDLRGRFIRMIGGNAAGMAVAQGDELRGHTHALHFMACTNQVANVHGNAVHCDNEYQGQVDMRSDWNYAKSSGGVETRPINMAFNYIIKVNTNVILYYVSNIIYKAIAIGKSLLSRAKEEVRRTMAISLKNHEDRIIELEKPYQHQVKEVKAGENGYIWFNNGLMIQWMVIRRPIDIGSEWVRIDFVTPFSETPYYITAQLIGNANYNQVAYEQNVCVRSYKSDNTCVYLFQNGTPYPAYKTNMLVIGLKQYYCFSNNILLYRLTQILFNSSLLGLFSQKGGARTI